MARCESCTFIRFFYEGLNLSSVLERAVVGALAALSNVCVDNAPLLWRVLVSAEENLERSITSLGVMMILPRWKAKFTRSPLDRPAWRRTAVGMVT